MKTCNKYVVTLKHDDGHVNLSIFATSWQNAIVRCLSLEFAPMESFISIAEYNTL